MAQTKEGFATYLTLLWLFLVFLVYYIIKIYAYPKNFPWHSYAAIFLTYYCSLGLMLIVPLDVSVTILCRRSEHLGEDYHHVNQTLSKMYTSFYIPATVLGSYFMFMQEEYVRQGAFSVGGKIYGVAKAVGLQMVAGIAFMMILFAILVSQKVATANGGAVLLALVLINNTIYLVMLMLFLGYGLVAFPLSLWEKGNLEGELKRSEHKAAVRYKNLGEATIVMGKAVADVMKTNEALERQLVEYPEYELTDAMKVVLSECPKDFHSSTLGTVCADKKGRVTLQTLADLRGRLYLTVGDYFMAKAKVEEASKSAYYHEDLIVALRREDQIRKIKWSFKDEGTEREYYWEIWYKPILYRVASISVGILSLFSYLGILGSIPNISRKVSVYDLAIHSHDTSGGGIVVFILVTLCYTAYAALWSIFQMKIAGMMELLPGQKTWPNSLSVNARVCAKFVAPTVFFYLSWIAENGTTTGPWTNGRNGKLMLTAFAEFYQIQVIPVIGDRFNVVFPVMIFIISFLVATNSINRTLVMLNMHSMQFGSEILSAEQLIEGRRQLDRHKRLMERATRRASLKEKIQSNFGGIAKTTDTESTKQGWGNLLFWKKKTAYEAAADVVDDIEEEPEEVKPNLLRGWGERKEEKSRLTSGWNKRYMYVESPGWLRFKKDPENEKEVDPVLDLRKVQHCSLVEEKTDKFGPRLLLEVPSSGDIRLRFGSAEDAEIWRSGLEQWVEYSKKHGEEFEQHNEDIESYEPVTSPRSRVESTHNPLSINVAKENDVESSNQEFTSIQIEEDESHPPKEKKKKKFSSFLSIIKPKSHQPIPTSNTQADIEDQSGDIESIKSNSSNPSISQTTSPFHKSNNNGNNNNNISNNNMSNNNKYSPASPLSSSSSSPSIASSTPKTTSIVSPMKPSTVSKPASLSLDTKPDKLEGWLEKKNKGGLGASIKLGHGWNRRYFRVLEKTGQLAYYSSDKEASINPSESSDLKLVIDIIDRKEGNRFDIEFEGSTLQLKASSPEEKDRWIDGLNEWKDYFLMNMC